MSPVAFTLRRLVWIGVTVGALAGVSALFAGGQFVDPYWFQILLVMGINVTLAVSLNLINGFCGQFSIGHAGFMAVGAYASAYFTLHAMKVSATDLSPVMQGAWMVAALAVSALTAGLVGILVGIPSLRLRGDYLAIVTLGFGEIIRVLILNIEAVGGASGLPDIPGLSNFFWIWLVALATIALSRNLFISSHGRAVLAVREDEIAAESLGVPTTKYKVRIFALGSALAGMAGCLSAHLDLYLTPGSFTFVRSMEIIVMVILGGLGSTTGAVVGAAFVTLLPEGLRFVPEIQMGAHVLVLKDLRMVIYSALLILLMLTRPRGLLGGAELSWDGLKRIGGRWNGGGKPPTPNINRAERKAADKQQGELL